MILYTFINTTNKHLLPNKEQAPFVVRALCQDLHQASRALRLKMATRCESGPLMVALSFQHLLLLEIFMNNLVIARFKLIFPFYTYLLVRLGYCSQYRILSDYLPLGECNCSHRLPYIYGSILHISHSRKRNFFAVSFGFRAMDVDSHICL